MICQYEDCKKEFIPSKHGVSKYCSTICRGRAYREKNGKGAKKLECISCGKPFKRVCAKDTKCVKCKKNIVFGKPPEDDYPKLDRDTELSMIEDFLQKKGITENE